MQDAVQNVVAFFFKIICTGLQAVTTGHTTHYSRFLLEKLIVALFFFKFHALHGGLRLKFTAFWDMTSC